jgi:DNA-binding YbaB/EbfC family protein
MPQPNLNKMMKQVQQMQEEMLKAQEQLKDEIVEASAGGGMVRVKITGDLELKEIKIDPEALGGEEGLSADDVDLLQDMVLAAVNEALRSAQELANRKLGGLAGGLPGGLGELGLPGL